MPSLTRRIARKAKRRAGTYVGTDQPTRVLPDGGYVTLRPTKGWIRISGARLRAQARMARIGAR